MLNAFVLMSKIRFLGSLCKDVGAYTLFTLLLLFLFVYSEQKLTVFSLFRNLLSGLLAKRPSEERERRGSPSTFPTRCFFVFVFFSVLSF